MPVTGRLNLSFDPAAAVPADDPAIQFSSGGRSAAFTIPANATRADFSVPQFALQTGSVAGTLSFAIDGLQAAGVNLSAPSAPLQISKVMPAAPSIRALTAVRTASGFEVRITGFSTAREITQATVRLIPSASSDLLTAEVIVPLADAARAWYERADSAPFGSQFNLVLPFTIQGNANAIDSVSLVLADSAGSSQQATARLQ